MHLGLARAANWKGASRHPVGSPDAGVGLGGALAGVWGVVGSRGAGGAAFTDSGLVWWRQHLTMYACCLGNLCISIVSGQEASVGLSDLSKGLEQETAGAGTNQSW